MIFRVNNSKPKRFQLNRAPGLLSVERQDDGADVHRVAERREAGRLLRVPPVRLRRVQHLADAVLLDNAAVLRAALRLPGDPQHSGRRRVRREVAQGRMPPQQTGQIREHFMELPRHCLSTQTFPAIFCRMVSTTSPRPPSTSWPTTTRARGNWRSRAAPTAASSSAPAPTRGRSSSGRASRLSGES